jgi:broad-specificity NMP kinase
MNNLNIIIAGTTGTGKSRVAILLHDFLFNHGFHVELNLLDEISAAQVAEMRESLPLAIDEIKQKSYITITEKSALRARG